MSNTGRIQITKRNEYVAITNNGIGLKGGHATTMNFLEAHRCYFDHVAFGNGHATLAIKADRLPKFIAYCESNGIEVVGA